MLLYHLYFIVLSITYSETYEEAAIFAKLDHGINYFSYIKSGIDNQLIPKESIVSRALFSNRINETGWSFLSVKSSAAYDDFIQAYWAGYLETNLTFDITKAHWINTVGGLCPRPLTQKCKSLENYLIENIEYMIRKISIWGTRDGFWHQVELQLWQIRGMLDAFSHTFVRSSNMLTRSYLSEIKNNVFGIYLIQISGDVRDIITALSLDNLNNYVNAINHEGLVRPSCSALIKYTSNNIYVGHVTFASYNLMLRVIKHYNFPWKMYDSKTSGIVPGTSITFSSYPSMIGSYDDFYVTNRKLVITETTHFMNNDSIFKSVKYGSRRSVFTFLRVMVANRLASNGRDWTNFYRHKNSGTYNNQWMIFDAKRVKSNNSLRDGAFTIVEQLPQIIMSQDMTENLRSKTYWASYNLPYFEYIYNLTGNGVKAKKYGDWYDYHKTVRALMFQRDHHKVTDLKSMHRIMRYNNYLNDPLSACSCLPPYSSSNAISPRSDLNPIDGYFPLSQFSHHLHGGTDVKIVNLDLIEKMSLLATSGPTHDDVPPFEWPSEIKPLMHPKKWDFEPIIIHFKNTSCVKCHSVTPFIHHEKFS